MFSVRRRAFTLVELLVVIAVIGLLIALLMPAIQASRGAARRVSCVNNLRQMGVALANHEQAKGHYPPSTTHDLTVHWRRFVQHSWASLLLPYLEEANLHDAVDFESELYTPENMRVATMVLPIYRCPDYSGPDHSEYSTWINHETGEKTPFAIGNYVALSASTPRHMWEERLEPEGSIYPQSHTQPKDVSDGLSKTVFLERIS